MLWYKRVLCAIYTAIPFLMPTQATNLALLVGAILKKRTLRLSELARGLPGGRGWPSATAHRGKASVISLALGLAGGSRNIPPSDLRQPCMWVCVSLLFSLDKRSARE